MTKFVTALLTGVLAISSCSVTTEEPSVEMTLTEVAQPATTTMIPPTTTTIPEVEVDVPTTVGSISTTSFVDFPDPVRMFSEALGVEAVVSDLSRVSHKSDPQKGEVMWYHTDDLVGPCENGLVNMYSHLNKGEPYFNLVDDSPRDNHGKDDHGLVVGDIVNYELADGTICTYAVIEPLGTDVENVKYIEGETFIYFAKDTTVMNPILQSLLAEVGNRQIVSMWVSYGGPNADEYRPDGKHRRNNAVVFAELVSITLGGRR